MKIAKIRFLALFILNFLIFSLMISSVNAQDIPPKPEPAKFVNDLVGMLKPEEAQLLENKLKKYADSTSTQIVIVIIAKLDTYSVDEYAQKLAETWGIGQKGKDNGLLILVSQTDRKMKIATGYGLEAKITDLTNKQIIDNQLVPNFKQQKYYQGFEEASNEIILYLKGEFKAEATQAKQNLVQKPEQKDFWDTFFILAVFGIFLMIIWVGIIIPVIPAMWLQTKLNKQKLSQWLIVPMCTLVFSLVFWAMEMFGLWFTGELRQYSILNCLKVGFWEYVIFLPIGALVFSDIPVGKTTYSSSSKQTSNTSSSTIISSSYSDYSKSYSDYKDYSDYSDKSSYSDSYSDSSYGGGSFGGGGASGSW